MLHQLEIYTDSNLLQQTLIILCVRYLSYNCKYLQLNTLRIIVDCRGCVGRSSDIFRRRLFHIIIFLKLYRLYDLMM